MALLEICRGNSMRSGVRAGFLAASAIWAVASAQAEERMAPAVADAEIKGVVAQADQRPVEVAQLFSAEHVTVSARRVNEDVQKVPVAISVVSDETIANTGAYN